MKKLLCKIFGHVEFMCKGCENQIMAIFDSEKASEWECTTPGCQESCRRCGASTR